MQKFGQLEINVETVVGCALFVFACGEFEGEFPFRVSFLFLKFFFFFCQCNFSASDDENKKITEMFAALEALLLGCSDRSSFVRDFCLASVRNVLLSSSVLARQSARVRELIDESLIALVSLMKDSVASGSPATLSSPGSSVGQQQLGSSASRSQILALILISGSSLLLKSSPFAIVPFVLVRRSSDLSLSSALVFAVRRCWELAQLEASEESLFLWKAFANCLVPNARESNFLPSEDLLSTVQELGLVQTSLLRLALQKVL